MAHTEKDHPAGAGKRCGSKRKRDFSRDVPQQRQTVDFPQACRKCRFSARENNRHDRPCGCAEHLHRAVRRVSPLCAALRPGCGVWRGRAEKTRVAPTCGQVPEQRRESPPQRENPPVREEPASHLASRRRTGSLPNAVCGQKPAPTSMETEET